jgi:predicted phage tail protein
MRTIHLYGPLAEEFGPQYRLDVASAAEAVRALTVVLGRRFVEIVRDGEWHVVAGEDLERGEDFSSPELLGFGLGARDLHLCPAIAGSGGGGFFKAILGIALVVAAVYFAPPLVTGTGPIAGSLGGMGAEAFSVMGMSVTFGNIAMSGLIMSLGGLSQMLTSTPQQTSSYSNRESEADRPSFLFNGARNTVEQGNPVAVVYGRMRVGGTIVSAGIEVEQI